MSKTNFDRHLEKHLRDPAFAKKFKKAGEEWDIALQLADLRRHSGLSQSQLARRLKTSQQQISRLESANYEGHSLSTLRRVAEALNAKVVVSFQTLETKPQVNEGRPSYNRKPSASKPAPTKNLSRTSKTEKTPRNSASKRGAKSR